MKNLTFNPVLEAFFILALIGLLYGIVFFFVRILEEPRPEPPKNPHAQEFLLSPSFSEPKL
jgi:hypothetical protein